MDVLLILKFRDGEYLNAYQLAPSGNEAIKSSMVTSAISGSSSL